LIRRSGNAVAYSATYSILAVAAFNDQSTILSNGYDLKSHGSVFLFRRQNAIAPANALAPHNQFVYVTKLNSADSSYLEHQRNHFGTCYIVFM
jgi:hypothetical protein